MQEGPKDTKAPVLLVVVVDPARLAWFVAGIGLDGAVLPLLRSEPGDLKPYQGLDRDDQLVFLRHRLCGVLQRGCERLWMQEKKARQFVFLFEGRLPDATEQLTEQVADHFVQWMLNPPVVVYTAEGAARPNEAFHLHQLAGDVEPALENILSANLGKLLAATGEPGLWELARRKCAT
jgi:hypothetical protein